MIAADVIGELLPQLELLPKTDALDLLIVSNGGDPTVAWRIVSLIRERVKKLSVLVPEAAFSAATLIALGADEIVMHANGNLGPVDPQIQPGRGKKAEGEGQPPAPFGSEDLAAFLAFVREEVGLSDQRELYKAFNLFCDDVGAVRIGVAARSARLTLSMGEQLLKLHMTDEGQTQKARAIAEALSKKFYHHGYPLGRREAKDIGLKVQDPGAEVEGMMWQIWEDIRDELEVRIPCNPLTLVSANAACAPLFAPTPQVTLPAGLPAPVAQQAVQQILQQAAQVIMVPPTPFTLIHAIVESARQASRITTEGRIFAMRQPDAQIACQIVPERQHWQTVPLPATSVSAAGETAVE